MQHCEKGKGVKRIRNFIPVLSQLIMAHERMISFSILAAVIFLSLWGSATWILANIDEISALNQLGIPFLSGASSSTNYLLNILLLKTVGVLLPFPSIRWMSALINIAGLYAAYRAARPVAGVLPALLMLLMLGFSWNILYHSRIFECGSFTPAAACCLMACVITWIQDRKKVVWLYVAGCVTGFCLNTHAMPCLYAAVLFTAGLGYAAAAGILSIRHCCGAVASMIAGSLPFIYSFFAFVHFSSDLSVSYSTLNQGPSLRLAVNFSNPLYYLRTLASYFTYYPITDASFVRFALTLASLVIVTGSALIARRSLLKDYLLLMTAGTLVLIGLSPIPMYNEGHLHFFWPHFILLLCLLIHESRPILQKTLLAAVFLLIFSLNAIWLPSVFQNQAAAVEAVLMRSLEADEPVYISDGFLLKIRHLRFYDIIKRHPVTEFVCWGDDAMKPLKAYHEQRKALIMITSDAPWPPEGLEQKADLRLLLSLEQLYEAYQTHGIRIYEALPR
jgi:hypothetical protein